MSGKDLEFGRRSIVQQKKLLNRHLEDLIRAYTNQASRNSLQDIKQFVMDVASGAKSYRKAAMDLGISYNTVNTWKRHGWIYEAVEIGKELAQDALDRRFTGVINKAIDNLEDRLDNGDGFVGKDGSLKRKPVTAKDNALIAAIAFDKRQLVRGEATSISDDKSSDERLQDLKRQFEQYAMREEKTIDGEATREQRASGQAEEQNSDTEVQGQLGHDFQEGETKQ